MSVTTNCGGTLLYTSLVTTLVNTWYIDGGRWEVINALNARVPAMALINNHTCKPREINAFRGLWTNRGSFDLPPDTSVSVTFFRRGGVAERLNALVLKTSEGESPPRVRISPPPPILALA